ncbi:hypothetical protein LOTGIDRAFT_239314 [Lottia gigantea]|uniref:Uncharacterized protein n=1 Tax=Lottia gigantea TaxID=225164 RepID=V4ANP1_LOTGI|nr:hypothetical protein LOTGIDRAFT_239314 [Lottia gigantea]ESO96360.1 hypothetical protein LOTGIDRAFT_239314 [Lottia gigantea]
MEAESESYFDLSFGKCSQTARRNDDNHDERNTNMNIFTASQNNQISSEDFITPVKPGVGVETIRSSGGTNIAMNYSHNSYSKYLVGRAQRNLPQNDLLSEITDENPVSGKNKKCLWNDINIMSARELPHPRHLRKRKKTGIVKEDTSRIDHGMAVENHLKQLKFYCSRVSREVTPTNQRQNNKIKTLTLDNIEIPPLPETPVIHRPIPKEILESFNVPINIPISSSIDTDRTPGFDRFPYHQSDSLTSFQPPGPVTFQSTSRRLNFDHIQILETGYQDDLISQAFNPVNRRDQP